MSKALLNTHIFFPIQKNNYLIIPFCFSGKEKKRSLNHFFLKKASFSTIRIRNNSCGTPSTVFTSQPFENVHNSSVIRNLKTNLTTKAIYDDELEAAIVSKNFELAHSIWSKHVLVYKKKFPINIHLDLVSIQDTLTFRDDDLQKINQILNFIISSQEMNWEKETLEKFCNILSDFSFFSFSSTIPSFSCYVFKILKKSTSSIAIQNLIHICLREGNFEAAEEIFEQSCNFDISYTSNFYYNLLGSLHNSNNKNLLVTKIFNYISPNYDLMTADMYLHFAKFYSIQSDLDKILFLLEDSKIRKVQLDWTFFEILLNNLIERRQYPEFMEYYSRFADCELPFSFPSFYTFLLSKPSVSKDFREYCAALNCQGNSLTIHQFNCIAFINIIDHNQSFSEIREQLLIKSLEPNWVTHFMFLDQSCFNEDIEEAFKILEVIKEQDICLNTIICSRLINASLETGKYDKFDNSRVISSKSICPASVYLKLIQNFTSKGNYPLAKLYFNIVIESNTAMNTVIANKLLTSLGKANDTEYLLMALDLLIQKKRIVPNTYTFNAILRSLCRHSPQKAREFFKLMLSKYSASAPPDIYSYNHLLRAFLRLNQYNSATALLNHLKVVGTNESYSLSPNNTTCAIFLWGLGKRKDLIGLEKAYKEFSSPPFNIKPCTSIYESLMFGYYNCNEFNKAKDIFKHALGNIGSQNINIELLTLYIGVLGAQASLTQLQGEWQELSELFKDKISKSLPIHTSYLQALIKCGGFQEAVESFCSIFDIFVHNRNFKSTINLIGKSLLSRERHIEVKALEEYISKHKPGFLKSLNKLPA